MPATAPAGPDERPAAAAVAAATRVPAGGPPSRASRRPELDVMRALVVAGLVVFHSAVVFAAGAS